MSSDSGPAHRENARRRMRTPFTRTCTWKCHCGRCVLETDLWPCVRAGPENGTVGVESAREGLRAVGCELANSRDIGRMRISLLLRPSGRANADSRPEDHEDAMRPSEEYRHGIAETRNM